jgi:hypothetical protein
MVAITAGLFVAISAFAVARQGSRFFQQEARVANAQFSATLGFDRLRTDIARAGFLTTANVQRDPFRCGSTAAWPSPGMPSLAAIRITQAAPAVVQDPTNGLAPDQITMTGSYATAETFPVRNVEISGGKYQVTLQQNNGGVVRANIGADGGGLTTVFQAGRVMRLLDATGRYEFGIIDSAGVNASGETVVSLRQSPTIPFKRDAAATCGVEGFGVGMQANVVNTIRYEIRDMKTADLPEYRPLYVASATAPGDEKRYELIRVELDSAGNEMAGTVEIVAEYAVDLRFGLTVATTGGVDPVLTEYAIGDAKIYDYAFDVAAKTTTPGPERIRAVRTRLTVRSREADRQSGLAPPAGSPPGTIFRYGMGSDGGSFARARALTADIQLPNLASIAW